MNPTPSTPAADRHRRLAARVAAAHQDLGDARLASFVSGSTVENLVDERSDVDMSVVLQALPEAPRLQACVQAAGGSPWNWSIGDPAEGSFVVSFTLDGTEAQIGYATHTAFEADLDELLLRHNPDTATHKLAEGILKAEPLVNEAVLLAWQARLAVFPPELTLAMVRHALKTPTHWRAAAQIVHRDTSLWCRDIQVDAVYRLLLALAGLNRRYFTRFQVKRLHKLAAALPIAPPRLADRIDTLLAAPPRDAFAELHALEGETLALLAEHLHAVDVSLARQQHARFVPG
jgi:hypothetical protein